MSETVSVQAPVALNPSKQSENSSSWRKDEAEDTDSKGSSSPVSSASPDSPNSLLKNNRESSPINQIFAESSQGSLFSAKNFSSFQFAREEQQTRSISPPGIVYEGQNPDPVYIPPLKTLGASAAPPRPTFPLHFGPSDNIWSPAYSNEKETRLWEKNHIQPLKFVTSLGGSALDR